MMSRTLRTSRTPRSCSWGLTGIELCLIEVCVNAKCQKYLEAREPLTSGHASLEYLIGKVLKNGPNMLEKVQEFDADFCAVVQGFLKYPGGASSLAVKSSP